MESRAYINGDYSIFFIRSSKIHDSRVQLWNLFLFMKTGPELTIYKQTGLRTVQITSKITSETNVPNLFQNINEQLLVETHLDKALTFPRSIKKKVWRKNYEMSKFNYVRGYVRCTKQHARFLQGRVAIATT